MEHEKEELEKKKRRERKRKEREAAKLPRNEFEASVVKQLRIHGWEVTAVDRKKYEEPTDIGWVAKNGDIVLTITITEDDRIRREMVLDAILGHEDSVSDHAVIIANGVKMTSGTSATVEVAGVICLEPDGIEYLSGSF